MEIDWKASSQEVQAIRRDRNSNQPDKWRRISIRLPTNYHPDLTDKNYRPPEIPSNEYHGVGAGNQAITIAALISRGGEMQRVIAKRYDICKFELHRKTFPSRATDYTHLLREIQNTQYLRNENIVEMVDSFWEMSSENELKCVWIVTERMDFNLHEFFRDKGRQDSTLDPKLRDHRHVSAMATQIFRALDYLHQRGIMHRDLKPENIGLNGLNFQLKLLDLGISGLTNSKKDNTKMVEVASGNYQPLEIHLVDKYDTGVDIWAAGLVILKFLGCKLTASLNGETTITRILNVMGVPEDLYFSCFGTKLSAERKRPSTLDEELERAFQRLGPDVQGLKRIELKDLIIATLTVNPQKRPIASDLLEFPYLKLMNKQLENQYKSLEANDIAKKNERDKEILMKMLRNFSRQI